MEKTTATENTQTLAAALEFTPDDLTANRAGSLSEMQDYRLRVRRRRSIAVGILILLMTAFIASLVLFLATREDGSAILTVIGIGVTIMSAAIGGIFARFWMRLHADIREGQVQRTEGTLERVLKPVNRRNINYMLRIDQAEVFVTKEVFTAFEHEGRYILYRLPHTGMLLSAERA